MSDKPTKILFAASEAAPFIKSGGLGDVTGSLTKALSSGNFEVSAVIPLYEAIPEEIKREMTYITSVNVPLSWRNQNCDVFSLERDGVKWYFLGNDYYFKRGIALYGEYDDAERFAFFSQAVLEVLPYINYFPDIIHCHDWQSAAIPLFLKLKYYNRDNYYSIKTVFTIHNIEYQGAFGADITENVLGLPQYEFDNGFLEHNGQVNLMKCALLCADAVTTVSPRYAEEIKTEEYGRGLDSLLRMREGTLTGILNGIDEKLYNPESDKLIFKNFSAKNLSGKAVNKAELQKLLNLPERAGTPVIGIVSRLVSHKGLDLVCAVFDELLSMDVQLVVLGTGEWYFEEFFREKEAAYPEKVSANITFNTELAQKIYAGADMFLMPSKSEPCGLAQMIALRYGTIPIVRETGGLSDSISAYNIYTEEGNGFSFRDFNAHDMLHVIREAISLYNDESKWSSLVKQGMACDFSWRASAEEYKKLYLDLTGTELY